MDLASIVLCLVAAFGAGETGPAAEPLRPSIGCWFWSEEEFQPEGYKRFLDLHAQHTSFGYLTTSLRYPAEVTDPAVHDRIAAAAAYAGERGMKLVLDLDVRLARAAFQQQYPEEMQELVRLQEAQLSAEGEVRVTAESITLADHYTFNTRPYETISSRLLRVYSYRQGEAGIDATTVTDITAQCRTEPGEKGGLVTVIPSNTESKGRTVCVLTALTLFSPSVFAPHLEAFERATLSQYADVQLAGACKDEWGFPGQFQPGPDSLWYCKAMDAAYAQRRPGRDLVYDLLLMSKGMQGREGERAAAINHYMELCRERNTQIENSFYAATKEVFGKSAFAGTHPTWFPYPDQREAYKNGLHWWGVKKDIAQTDETTPFSVRTALSKKWGSATWLNMYYAPEMAAYEGDLWRHALGGGRMNFHPFWPAAWKALPTSLLGGELLKADTRARMLDFISTAPIDCPVAVIFGHPAFLNWSGPGFADAGVAVADALWKKGLYADLIPTSEITNGSLQLAEDGSLVYGPQRYRAAVLYHPQFARPAVAEFMAKVREREKTAVFRMGSWDTTFEGEAFDAGAALPEVSSVEACVNAIEQIAESEGIFRQTACEKRTLHDFPASMVPRRSGVSKLIDGTIIVASGEHAVLGDPIQQRIPVGGSGVEVDAVGIAAVRVNEAAEVVALAAGGLKKFKGGGIELTLDGSMDVALWRTPEGEWQGAVAGAGTRLPQALLDIAPHWRRVRVPQPFQD